MQPWSFAVLSDLHLPNPRAAMVDQTIQTLIAMRVRLVIVTGDHTNGSDKVDHRRGRVKAWVDCGSPMRSSRCTTPGIAVLPVAGNHDTYLSWQARGLRASVRRPSSAGRRRSGSTAARGQDLHEPPYSYKPRRPTACTSRSRMSSTRRSTAGFPVG